MAHTPKDLSTGGYVRLVIYIVGAILGLAALVAAILGYNDLGALLGAIGGGAAAVTGGTATFNLEKAPDNKTPIDARELLPAIMQITDAARQYRRDTPEQEITPAPQPAPSAPDPADLPVYPGHTTAG